MAEGVETMKAGIHPDYMDTKVVCACGNTFTVFGEPKFSFSAHNYTQKSLHNAKHQEDLEFVDSTVICIDGFMRGTGTNTCGPDTMEKYQVKTDKTLSFKFAFKGE